MKVLRSLITSPDAMTQSSLWFKVRAALRSHLLCLCRILFSLCSRTLASSPPPGLLCRNYPPATPLLTLSGMDQKQAGSQRHANVEHQRTKRRDSRDTTPHDSEAIHEVAQLPFPECKHNIPKGILLLLWPRRRMGL
jgi:hypothetical protein